MKKLVILGTIGTTTLIGFQFLEIMHGHGFNPTDFATALIAIWGSFIGVAVAKKTDDRRDDD